jgi:hypothetical protein
MTSIEMRSMSSSEEGPVVVTICRTPKLFDPHAGEATAPAG